MVTFLKSAISLHTLSVSAWYLKSIMTSQGSKRFWMIRSRAKFFVTILNSTTRKIVKRSSWGGLTCHRPVHLVRMALRSSRKCRRLRLQHVVSHRHQPIQNVRKFVSRNTKPTVRFSRMVVFKNWERITFRTKIWASSALTRLGRFFRIKRGI